MTVRTFYTGTVEYLDVTVTADVDLVAQAVAISFDRTEWLTATWIGASGTTRTAQLLMNASTLPARGTYPVYVRITDTPEIPILKAGGIKVL